MVPPLSPRWQGVRKVLENPKVQEIPNEELRVSFLEFVFSCNNLLLISLAKSHFTKVLIPQQDQQEID